jgi:hypothetical protein
VASRENARGVRIETSEQDRILQRAFELQAEEETEQEQALAADELRLAAADVGLDPAYLAKAEEDLKRVSARKRSARRALLLVGAAVTVTAGLAAGALRVLDPPAPAAFTQDFDVPGSWALDVNAGTQTRLRFEDVAGRGRVAVVEVEKFAPDAAGKFRASLRSSAIPNHVDRYDSLALDVKGSLPAARVYLQAGASERWRSQPIQATQAWTTQRVSLKDFEHETYEGGRWMSIDSESPRNITEISIDVGQAVNGADASGKIAFDNLKLE